MKSLIALPALALVLGTGAALAQSLPAMTDVDADANGTVSMTELQAVLPALTEENFIAFDTDGDGEMSAEEYQTLSDALAGGAPGGSADPAPMEAPAQ